MTGFERFRRKNLLTRAELSELMGVTVAAISVWESGEGTPSMANLRRLSEIYGVTMEELLRKDYPESGLAEIKAKGA